MFRTISSRFLPGLCFVFMVTIISSTATYGQVAKFGSPNGSQTGPQNHGGTKPGPVIAVPVRDVDKRTPFQTELGFTFGANGTTVRNPFTVPDGKRLIITFISAEARIGAGGAIRGSFLTEAGDAAVVHHVVMTPQGRFGALDIFSSSQAVEVPADPGTNVEFFFDTTNTTGSTTVQVSVAGYLVDVP